MSFIDRCAWFVEDLSFDGLPREAVKKSENAILDTVAVTLAGSREPVAQKLIGYLLKDRAGGPCTVMGTPHRFAPASAAMINATMAHALDYDDVSPTTRSHPSAVVAPVALALGEALGAGGKDVITAYVAGVEVITRVGMLVAFAQFERGWHNTSVLGSLGAAAAAAKLLGLPAGQIAAAFGIAASEAGGLQRNFGTMSKPLHCGLAAQAGVMAAFLAGDGFTASADVFSGRVGYVGIFGGNPQDLEDSGGINFGNPFEIVSPGLHVKRYPCCFATHRAADAVLSIMEENPRLDPGDIELVTCNGPRGSFFPLVYNLPQNGLEAKFSMQYVVAAGITDQKITLQSFTDMQVQRREAQDLMKRIEKTENESVNFAGPDGKDQRFTEVSLKLKDGRSITRRVDRPRGAPDVPLSREEMIGKYVECSENLLDPRVRDRTREMLLNLAGLGDISALLANYRTA